ncbi:hypothetical protein KAI32_00025 [Candidatus Pacearchaeota archaeon]|nr:hypothetical protein [Candidatus Pacearchaeota archaeon]
MYEFNIIPGELSRLEVGNKSCPSDKYVSNIVSNLESVDGDAIRGLKRNLH